MKNAFLSWNFREASEFWHRYEDANRKRGYVSLGNGYHLTFFRDTAGKDVFVIDTKLGEEKRRIYR